jgi:hypothetical protein
MQNDIEPRKNSFDQLDFGKKTDLSSIDEMVVSEHVKRTSLRRLSASSRQQQRKQSLPGRSGTGMQKSRVTLV